MKLKPWTVKMVLTITVMALAAMSGTGASAQNYTLREDTWITNGTVRAVVRTPDTVYIGGDFTCVGPSTGCGVPLDASTGAPVTTYPKVNGTVAACIPDGSGGWFIGGDFNRVGGFIRNGIAHILADGTVDPDWNPNANGGVYALAVSGSTIYAGGYFTSIGGQSRNRIAALDATTGTVTDWNPNADGRVYALAVSGSTVYAGGKFYEIGGQTRNYIAAIDASTGVATAWNPHANGYVYALTVSGSIIYVGGDFYGIGGQVRIFIAAIDASTGVATAWNPGASNPVYAFAVSGSTVYAGGWFTYIGGQPRNYIAALDAVTGIATPWNPNANNRVVALAVSGSIIYTGGKFSSIGGQSRNFIAALDTATGNATAWNPCADNQILTLAVSGSTVYVGGYFGSIGMQKRNRIAALDAETGAATDWNPNANSSVYALAVSDSTIYAGGYFTSIGGQTRNRIAALDAATGDAIDWNPDTNSLVRSLVVSDSTIYAGGDFTNIGGQTRNRIAAIDAVTGAVTDWNPNANSPVFALAVSGSTIYVGGNFSYIGGKWRYYISAIDAITGSVSNWKPNANDSVYALAISDQAIYAGGEFSGIGGQLRNRIAALNADTGAATDWNPSANNTVYSLAISDSTVYAGGDFTSIDGQMLNHIAALNTATGTETDWNLNANGTVYSLAVSGSTIYAGGDFTTIGGNVNRKYFAQLILGAMSVLPAGGSYKTGDQIKAQIVMNTAGDKVLTVQVTLNIDPAFLEVADDPDNPGNPLISIDSQFPLIVDPGTVSADKKTITIAANNTGGVSGSAVHFADITFNVLKDGTAKVTIKPAPDTQAQKSGAVNILGIFNNASYTIGTWKLTDKVDGFDLPVENNANGILSLQSTSSNTFGFWYLEHAVTAPTSQTLYRARCVVKSDQSDPSKTPTFRIRYNAVGFVQGDFVQVNSNGAGEASPATIEKLYDLYFRSMYEIVVPEFYGSLSFDMINIGNPTDATNATLFLDYLQLDKMAIADLGTQTSVKLYTFNASQENWTNCGTLGSFTPPNYTWDGVEGVLIMESINNTNTFGYWQNKQDDVAIDHNVLYQLRVKAAFAGGGAKSSAATAQPTMRVRMYDHPNNHVNSSFQTPVWKMYEQPVTSVAKRQITCHDYFAYFHNKQGIGPYLGIAIDLINLDENAPADAWIAISEVELSTLPIPTF